MALNVQKKSNISTEPESQARPPLNQSDPSTSNQTIGWRQWLASKTIHVISQSTNVAANAAVQSSYMTATIAKTAVLSACQLLYSPSNDTSTTALDNAKVTDLTNNPEIAFITPDSLKVTAFDRPESLAQENTLTLSESAHKAQEIGSEILAIKSLSIPMITIDASPEAKREETIKSADETAVLPAMTQIIDSGVDPELSNLSSRLSVKLNSKNSSITQQIDSKISELEPLLNLTEALKSLSKSESTPENQFISNELAASKPSRSYSILSKERLKMFKLLEKLKRWRLKYYSCLKKRLLSSLIHLK